MPERVSYREAGPKDRSRWHGYVLRMWELNETRELNRTGTLSGTGVHK